MNILVSACLLGFNVKYDGTNNSHLLENSKLDRLKKMVNIIPFCPEASGGLPCPRTPCEIQNGRVISETGEDKTKEYQKGAEEALKAAKMFNCPFALLKESSPSCGHGTIYDGTFSHRKTEGNGITASLLKTNNIRIYGETEIDDLLEAVRLAKAPMQLSLGF